MKSQHNKNRLSTVGLGEERGVTGKILSVSVLISLAATGLGTAAIAQLAGDREREPAAVVEARERATEQTLLEALLERREQTLLSTAPEAVKAARLELLDRWIAEVRRRLAS